MVRAWLNEQEIDPQDLLVKITTEPVYGERVFFQGLEINHGDTLRLESQFPWIAPVPEPTPEPEPQPVPAPKGPLGVRA
jgi:hypothetical protein